MNQEKKLQQRRYKEEERIRKRREKMSGQVSTKEHISQSKFKHDYKQHKKQLEVGTIRYEIAQKPMEFIFMILAILFVIGVVIFINQQENSEVPILEQDVEDIVDMQNIVEENVANWDVSSVTDMSDMFKSNVSWDTSNLHEQAIEVILNNKNDTYKYNNTYNRTINSFIDFDISSPVTLIILMILPLFLLKFINGLRRMF